MKNLKKILNKNSWNGKEVGQVLLASLIHDIKHQQEPNYKPLFSQDDFDRMECSLNSDKDFAIFFCYQNIFRSLLESYSKGQGLHQKFYHGFYRYFTQLMLCINADKALAQVEHYPLIMTQMQYDRLKKEAEKKKKNYKESFYNILMYTLEYFNDNEEKIPDDIKKALEVTKKQPVTNKRLLSLYNRTYDRGYYILSDGRRSDEMSDEEWQDILKEFALAPEDALKYYNEASKLFFMGISCIKETYKNITGKELILGKDEEERFLKDLEYILKTYETLEYDKILKSKILVNPLMELINNILYKNKGISIKWNYYDEPPKNLSKYDMLESYVYSYKGIYADDINEKEQYKEFIADYPDLNKALIDYIEKNVPAFKNINIAQFFSESINWSDLAELDFLDYNDMIKPDETDIINQFMLGQANDNYTKHRRILFRGIAIIQNPKEYQLDTEGNYIEEINPLSNFENLDSLAKSDKMRQDLIDFQDDLLKPALKFLYSFNILMKIVGNVYDIEELETVHFSTEMFEQMIENFNNALYSFYVDVYGDNDERKRKRKIIKDCFCPIDVQTLKPAQEAINVLSSEIAEIGFSESANRKLRSFYDFIFQLMGEEL